MGYSNTLSSLISSRTNTTTTKGKGSNTVYGRVEDIILTEQHPDYQTYGGASAINGVVYRPLFKNNSNSGAQGLKFAYQDSSFIKTVPVVGEIVVIQTKPFPSNTGFQNKTRRYYTGISNIWNNPNTNIYPDLLSTDKLDFTQKGTFKESGTINPIQSAPGDVQLEGRNGQSIRFTASAGNNNPWVDTNNLGKPVTIISNGQSETQQGFSPIAENINEDDSSIYLTSDHAIPLTQASTRRLSYLQPPSTADTYRGKQIIINSGRLFLNARDADIQLSSEQSVGITTLGTVNIDADTSINLDANKIFLGTKPLNLDEQVRDSLLLGNNTEKFLEDVLNILQGMAQDMVSATTVDGKPIPNLNRRGAQTLPLVQSLRSRINPNGPSSLKSKKIHVE